MMPESVQMLPSSFFRSRSTVDSPDQSDSIESRDGNCRFYRLGIFCVNHTECPPCHMNHTKLPVQDTVRLEVKDYLTLMIAVVFLFAVEQAAKKTTQLKVQLEWMGAVEWKGS